MLKAILRWILFTLFLMFIPTIVEGIQVRNSYAAAITVFVLGVINALIRPILILLTLPINILTLGLFTLVINALLFWFAASFVKGFEVAGFMSAFWGALLYSIFTMFINWLDRSSKD